MFGLGKVKGEPPLADVLQRLTVLERIVREYETELISMGEQMRKWMRRSVAAERAAGRNQEPGAHGTPVTPGPSARMTSARLRAMQQGRPWGGPGTQEINGGEDNGVHP